MENASGDYVTARSTHSTYVSGYGPSGCAKISHRIFLNSMPIEPQTVLSRQPSYKGMFRKIPNDEISTVDLCPVFCKAVTERKVCPGYMLHHSETKYDLHSERLCKVDVGLYKIAEVPEERRTSWNHQRMWLEFRKKGDNAGDPFSDEESGDTRQLILEQLSLYAETAMIRENRTYTVLVMHKFARLIRWDHSGAIVTQKFDYKAHPEIVGEFFWRFAHMTDESQGYDPTAQLVSPDTTLYRLMDKMATEKLLESSDYIGEAFQKSLDAGWLRYNLAVEDKERGTRYFLVGKPQHVSSGLVGHGSRSCVAIDVEKEEFVHLKDHWRHASDVTDEGDDVQQDKEDSHPLRTGGLI
ncbi:hypothetical protein A0H81_06309 [Grifola frondosa]|uniref:Fungal-type protein kinase domain-containing protein n=1 Tax=Grifola frondosa TaxID=5627 RepID=A0A1C7MAH8_GRIFR|nr:hypothetical protein A0H81_06309 [Grifola frondosa]